MKKKNAIGYWAVLLLLCCPLYSGAQELFEVPRDASTRWVSFENLSGAKGAAALKNQGAKGDASRWIKAGDSVVILDYTGCGVIRRIWMTFIDRSPEALRSIRLDIYWDGAGKPAVSVPVGDFFGIGLGRTAAFQSALFSNPEGKSFNCYIPMPFKTRARMVFVNQSQKDELLFYDVDMTVSEKPAEDLTYFHAYWSDNEGIGLGEDFEILPRVRGRGRFLGCNISVRTDSVYRDTWFGEGEVKIYLDGDGSHPTLAGTGTEDYLGSAWSLGPFSQLYQGAPVVDKQKGQYAFYRYHVPDPVYFQRDCRVTIQQMGGGGRNVIRSIVRAGGKVRPVSVMTAAGLVRLLDTTGYPGLFEEAFPADDWVNFYRIDHYAATAYFYLDTPDAALPPLAPLSRRLKYIR
ncbi:hypothetical protein GCM10023143_27480 [Compostibacter hankyongensis]|uniref:DUF2961 domain-containing protein n=2 Tax=Compostibacter hankyongensis TaxID=1007089 RepID=A0ABP8G2D5_9BACT